MERRFGRTSEQVRGRERPPEPVHYRELQLAK